MVFPLVCVDALEPMVIGHAPSFNIPLPGFTLALLASALLGGYFQKPPLEPKPLAASWLLRPREQNAFAKFSAIDAELWHVYFAGPLRGWAVASETTGFAL